MGRPRREVPPPPIEPPVIPEPVVPADVVVIVPAFPMFSPAAAAEVLRVHRGTVHNWFDRGKLEFFRDNIGERYVLRAELIRFIRDYLQWRVHE